MAITMFMQGTHKERPLTHDLLAHVLRALGAKIDRVVVNDVKDGTYFARLVLSAENETQQKKIIKIDARSSDRIAMATQQLAPIFVSLDVWDEVEDMTQVLRKLQQKGPDMEQSDEEKNKNSHDFDIEQEIKIPSTLKKSPDSRGNLPSRNSRSLGPG
jgi:bifunctional DNase/RNase